MFASLFVFSSFLHDNELVLSDTLLDDESVSIIFSGDIMGHSPQFQAAYNKVDGTYNYDICFRSVKPYIDNADIAVTNLEVPLAGKPYSGYPYFSSPDALLDALKNAGYDVILTANNHVLDRGKYGLERTLKMITDRKLKHAGSYVNKSQKDSIYPLMLEKKGIKIALLNYTYGTNGNKLTPPNVVNRIDTNVIKNDIRRAKMKQPDLTVITLHWGNEYELQANTEQQMLARLFVREGVDLLIGGHPHVVQNAEFLNSVTSVVPVFYSLGNSISNQRKPHTDGGIMVKVKIGVHSKKIINTTYLPVYVYRGVLNKQYQYHLIPTIDFIKSPQNFPLPVADSLALRFFDNETKKRLPGFQVLDEQLISF